MNQTQGVPSSVRARPHTHTHTRTYAYTHTRAHKRLASHHVDRARGVHKHWRILTSSRGDENVNPPPSEAACRTCGWSNTLLVIDTGTRPSLSSLPPPPLPPTSPLPAAELETSVNSTVNECSSPGPRLIPAFPSRASVDRI